MLQYKDIPVKLIRTYSFYLYCNPEITILIENPQKYFIPRILFFIN